MTKKRLGKMVKRNYPDIMINRVALIVALSFPAVFFLLYFLLGRGRKG